MTDKQIIELFKGIKKNCQEYTSKDKVCHKCKFYIEEGEGNIELWQCQVRNLAETLIVRPNDWNIEELERIIKQ